ncbi:DEAD/DEAH box helicase family protein [Methanomassiliicoccales archaeon LGM-DZ1]|nr:DEAD/DEAH box helicase family protein [Methanomassiliicoccales archaeon LGM-DZ1]
MRTFFCPQCGAMVLPGVGTCPSCGTVLGADGPQMQEPVPEHRQGPATVSDASEMKAPFLPYEPREFQLQIISDIVDALDRHRHIVIESGTGTGKTIVSLAGALQHARKTGKKIIYTTRTISQSDQVMKELKAISSLKPVSGITLTGRSKSCPLLQSRPDFADLSPSALSTLCSDRKQKSLQNRPGGCQFFEQVEPRLNSISMYARRNFPRSEELDAFCRNLGACPYEAKKLLLKDFDVVVAPYVHIIDPEIRKNLLTNMGVDEKGIVLIVDEAHNLIDAVRQQESFTITARLVASAHDEAMLFTDASDASTPAASQRRSPQLCQGVTMTEFVRAVGRAMKDLGTKYIGFNRKETALPPKALEGSLCAILGIDDAQLGAAVNRLIELGEKREEAIADTDAPSSPVLELGHLLEAWIKSPDSRYVRAVRADADGEFLTASCIDPADIVTFMRSLPGAVHMSGTLQPLAQYARVMGLPGDSIPRTYPSPFPKENRLVVYTRGLSTKYDELKSNPSMWPEIQRTVAKLCNSVRKNTLVFMPSYSMMGRIRPYLEEAVDKPLYWEEKGRQRNTMRSLDAFRRGRDGVFVCVMGGSVAEGMDFPGDELCFAVIVGMPYPPPSLESDAMKTMFDSRYGAGMGWVYCSEVPAVRKIRQAIGRLIRTETDRGMAVIIDSRAARNARQLGAVPTDDPVGDAARFFSG